MPRNRKQNYFFIIFFLALLEPGNLCARLQNYTNNNILKQSIYFITFYRFFSLRVPKISGVKNNHFPEMTKRLFSTLFFNTEHSLRVGKNKEYRLAPCFLYTCLNELNSGVRKQTLPIAPSVD